MLGKFPKIYDSFKIFVVKMYMTAIYLGNVPKSFSTLNFMTYICWQSILTNRPETHFGKYPDKNKLSTKCITQMSANIFGIYPEKFNVYARSHD